MSDAISLSAAQPAPVPAAGPTPRPPSAPAPRSPPLLGADSIARPIAKPSPGEPNREPSTPGDALPVLIAAGLLAGGAAVALPSLEALGAAGVAGARTFASAFGKSGEYASAALRDFAASYRERAGHLSGLVSSDPHEFGAALGAQAWNATEEGVRGAVVGAGLGAGAWAAGKVGDAVTDALDGHRAHADRR